MTRSDLLLTWPEWLVINLLLQPKQHPAAEGKSQSAHTAAEAEVPMHVSQKASSPARVSVILCLMALTKEMGNVSPTAACEPSWAPL